MDGGFGGEAPEKNFCHFIEKNWKSPDDGGGGKPPRKIFDILLKKNENRQRGLLTIYFFEPKFWCSAPSDEFKWPPLWGISAPSERVPPPLTKDSWPNGSFPQRGPLYSEGSPEGSPLLREFPEGIPLLRGDDHLFRGFRGDAPGKIFSLLLPKIQNFQ